MQVCVDDFQQTVAILADGYKETQKFDDRIMGYLANLLDAWETTRDTVETRAKLFSVRGSLHLVAKLPLPVYDYDVKARCQRLCNGVEKLQVFPHPREIDFTREEEKRQGGTLPERRLKRINTAL